MMRELPWSDDAANMRSLIAYHIVIHIPHAVPFVEIALFKQIMLHIEWATFEGLLVLDLGLFELAEFESVAVL